MNKSFRLRPEDREPKWIKIDATGQVLGRLATQVTEMLRGKNKPYFTPHTDCGDYIVIVNAEKIKLTGNKLNDKIYERYTGYIGNKKEITAGEMLAKHPERIIELAVKRMMPDNKLRDQMIKKLKVYAGAEHPHMAQLGQEK